MPAQLIFRVLTPEDADAYCKVRLEALESEPRAFGSSPEEHRLLSREEVKRRLTADPENQFVVGAFAQGVLLGTAGFYRDPGLKARHKGHIRGVYVKPEQRGTGVAREMLRVLLETVKLIEGIEQIHLAVTTTQHAAAKLYRSLGFEPYGREPRALKVDGEYIDEDFLVLRLKR